MSPAAFIVFAVLLVASALSVVLQPSPIRSALSLIVTLFLMAMVFLFLDAQLVAVLQVIVYAGAIMVLFLFVIMLLNLQEQPRAVTRLGMRLVAFLSGSLLLLALTRFFVTPRQALDAASAPGMGSATPAGFGSVPALGTSLFTRYLLAFEVTSVLLLVAVVGAVVLAKRKLA